MPLPGNFEPPDLHQSIVRELKANQISDRLQAVIREAFEETLVKHGIIIHYAERDRLFARVMRSVLEGMLAPGWPPT